jgi:hypothetical protein
VIIFSLLKKSVTHILFLLMLFTGSIHAQQQDSTSVKQSKEVKKAIYGSARKAAIMSACLPGLGQVYNGKRAFWKVPLIYAALGGIGYWGINNHIRYKYYSNNLAAIYDNDANTTNTSGYSSDQLVTEKKYYKKYRDIAIMVGALVYIINIIDANVEAHLKTFDISDDLSLQLKPYGNLDYNNNLQTGLTLKLRFK